MQRQNVMEIVETDHLPLIISMNSHSLKDFSSEWQTGMPIDSTWPDAAIQERGQHSIERLKVRKETNEEHRLHHSARLAWCCDYLPEFLFGYLTLVSIPLLQESGLVITTITFIIATYSLSL